MDPPFGRDFSADPIEPEVYHEFYVARRKSTMVRCRGVDTANRPVILGPGPFKNTLYALLVSRCTRAKAF
jgi:hypothetical protein